MIFNVTKSAEIFFLYTEAHVDVEHYLLSGAPICVFLYQFIITFAIRPSFPNICIYVVFVPHIACIYIY